MTTRREKLAEPPAGDPGEEARAPDAAADEASAEELLPVTGTMKWFDATRGFGFMGSDAVEGDVLVHFSVLKEHDRRSLPEGAVVECLVARQERGVQARRALSIDLTHAAVADAQRSAASSPREGVDPAALLDEAGDFERVRVKWFNRLKG